MLALRDGAFELVLSPQLIEELDGVLRRERFRRYVTTTEVDDYLKLLRELGVVVDDPAAAEERLSEDPGDEYLIALARAARVDALVSGDPHLLKLRSLIPARTPREFMGSLEDR